MKIAGRIYKQPFPWLIFILLLLLAGTVLAQAPATGAQVVNTEVLAQGLRVSLALAEPEIEPAQAEGRLFSRLTLEGAGVDNEPGCPALPLVHYTCQIPAGVKVKVTAQEQRPRQVRVAHPIWPQQPPVSKGLQLGAQKLVQDEAGYFGAGSAVWQKARKGALQVTTYRKRGQDYVDVMAHPFAYHVQKGLVQYPQELVLNLAFEPPELPKAAGPRTGRITVLKLKVRGPEDLAWLTRGGYNFERRGKAAVEIYATETEAQALRAAGYAVEEIGAQSSAADNTLKAASVGDGYHTYATLTAALQQYSVAFTNLCRVSSIGQSVQGRELWAVKITSDPDQEQGKPRVRLGSTLDGDEPLGTELCLNLVDLLLTGSQTNARLSIGGDHRNLGAAPAQPRWVRSLYPVQRLGF